MVILYYIIKKFTILNIKIKKYILLYYILANNY